MQLRECDVSLRKVRVYRDCAEVLLCAKLTSEELTKGSETNLINAWRASLGPLTEDERNSLRVLSPKLTLLHLEWVKDEVLDRSKRGHEQTSPVKPLSLPPPKLKEGRHRALDTKAAQHVLSDELKEQTLEIINAEMERWNSQPPNSVELIKRRLAVIETLNQLQERWRQRGSSKIEKDDASHDSSEELKPPKVEEKAGELATIISDKELDQSLCLYFQTDHTPSQSLPRALQGAWIDSVQPRALLPVEEVPKSSSLSRQKESEGIWLRMLLSTSYWSPSVELSIHGDHGRLNLYAELEKGGLTRLLKHLNAAQGSKNEKRPDSDHALGLTEVSFEWINDDYHCKGELKDDDIQTRESIISSEAILKGDKHRVCFESLGLVSRTLRDLEGERELIASAKRALRTPVESETEPPALGYFTQFVSFRYPPALVIGDESALTPRSQISLCLPQLTPFLEELLSAEIETGGDWVLSLEGQRGLYQPVIKHQQAIIFELGAVEDVFAYREEHGLAFTSHRSHSCRVGILSTDGSMLVDELELQGLGFGALRHLDQTLSTLSDQQEGAT